MSKTIFITGASSGLGKATAKLFQSKGWNVIATLRNPENETELSQLENITLLPLDVTNLEQIKETVAKAIELGVDVVFNNAGYALMGVMEAYSDEKIVRQIDTNVLGVMRVTQAFIPYFREKKKGLFISTTSVGGVWGFPLSSVYNATKFAIEGWSESISLELSQFGIGVKTVAPGLMLTDFVGRSADMNSSPEYKDVEAKVYKGLEGEFKSASTAEYIADVVYEAATDGKDQIRYVAGDDAKTMYATRQEVGNEAFRQGMQKNIFG
jgi:NAD(P)-dependent dehydrogenase (short-subunit alcohol dehydrogenase family)